MKRNPTNPVSQPVASPLKRVKYTQGMVLGVDEFQTEQEYFLQKLRRHNRYLHGWGVVCGLSVSVDGDIVKVDEGYALDCAGNEILVPGAQQARLPADKHQVFVVLFYRENESDLSPLPGVPPTSEGEAAFTTRIVESFEIQFSDQDPWEQHNEVIGVPCGCSIPHGIPLAQLRLKRRTWRLNRWYHRPRPLSFGE